MIAFEETSRELIIAGEPLLTDQRAGQDQDLLQAFSMLAKRRGKGICGYYVGSDWQSKDYSKVFLGTTSRILLPSFDLHSPAAKEVRRGLRKGRSHNYRVIPLKGKVPADVELVKDLHRKWMVSKLPLRLRFLLSEPQAQHLTSEYEEWFVVEKGGEFLAFISLLPYLRRGQLCFYFDNIIHDPTRESHALSF